MAVSETAWFSPLRTNRFDSFSSDGYSSPIAAGYVQVCLSLASTHNAVYRMVDSFRPLFDEFEVKLHVQRHDVVSTLC